MSTLADADIRAQYRDRIRRLDPGATAKWGRMTAPQMVCHQKYASPPTRLLQKTFI
jgi:hypothetical protein